MKNKAYLTAIKRNKLSAPIQHLVKKNILPIGEMGILDYGCGRGFDAETLNFAKYDPHFFPNEFSLLHKWGCVVCNYVLNVVSESEAQDIVGKIRNLLTPDGVAYISVRRDVKTDGLTSKGTFQRNVILDLPIEVEKKNQFCIYKLTK